MFSFKKKSIATIVGLVVTLLVLLAIFKMVGKKEMFENAVTVTYFYLPECPYCKDFKPEWNKYVAKAKNEGVKTVDVDGSSPKNAKLVTEKGVKGYPTIIVSKDGKDFEFNKERTAAELTKFVKNPSA